MMNAPLYECLTWTGRVQYLIEERVEDSETIEALTAFNPAGGSCLIGDEDPRCYPATEEQLRELPGGPEALDAWRAHDYSALEEIDAQLLHSAAVWPATVPEKRIRFPLGDQLMPTPEFTSRPGGVICFSPVPLSLTLPQKSSGVRGVRALTVRPPHR